MNLNIQKEGYLKNAEIAFKESNKNKMTFKPQINPSNMKSNYYQERLPALIEREKLRAIVLEEMKKDNEENELKECSFKPVINKPKKNKKMEDCPSVYEKLYNEQKQQNEKMQLLKEKYSHTEKEITENCTFKPKLISQESYKMSMNSFEKPKGFDEFRMKMRDGILKTQNKKYLESLNNEVIEDNPVIIK